MIQFTCPSCSETIDAADTQAGQTIACPHCQAAVVVPTMAQPGQAPPASAPPTPPAAAPARKQMTESEEKTWGMFCHLAALAAFVGVPVGNIVGPLIVWLIKREQSDFVAEQGRNALNFQISMAIYTLLSALLIFFVVGIFLLIGLGVFNLVMVILSAIRANRGEIATYPLCIEFIK